MSLEWMFPVRVRKAILALALSSLALAACGGGGGGSPTANVAAGSSSGAGSTSSSSGGSTSSSSGSSSGTTNSGSTTQTLTVTSNGGVVTSTPSGINCGSSCSASFNTGQSVVLSQLANGGYTFAGWSGACTGTGNCTVAMTATETVNATYNAPTSACAQGAGSTVFTVTPTSGNGYAYTRYGNYFVTPDDWGGASGTTVVWMNSATCWGTTTTMNTEQSNLPISPLVSRGWLANAGELQSASTSGYPNNPNWTTLSGMGLQVSAITKVHAKWTMTVPTTLNVGDTVSRWDALMDIYFHTAAQGAPNPPSSAWPPMVDLQIYQMLMDQPLAGQPANLASYWAGIFLNGHHPFIKTVGGNTYVGTIDGQTFNASGGHTISLFLTPTAYTDSTVNGGTTSLLWGKTSTVHDVGGLIQWLSSANPKDDSGNPIMNASGATVTAPLIDPTWYLDTIVGGFELDFGTTNNNQWSTTNFWVAVQNEADGN